jgi:serine/threonine protein kinase
MGLRFAPGSRIRQYRIGEFLGRGGMGEVYAAEDVTPRERLRSGGFAGGTPRRLALPLQTTIEAWFPDGKGLLVSKMDNGVGNLWRWDIATATLRQMTHFTNLSLSGAAISPDGKRVAFFRGFTERQAVLLKKTENK